MLFRSVLALAGAAIAVTPAMWVLTIPGHDAYNMAILCVGHVLVGTIWAGVNVCQFSIVLATSPQKDRGTYMAAGFTIQALLAGISPVLGAALLTTFRSHFEAAEAYKLVFGVTMGARFIAILFLAPVREEGSARIRATLRDLARISPRGMKAMRTLAKPSDVAARGEAIKSAAKAHYALASDEIVKALHDPAPRVRREAAQALAKLGDPAAAESLIHQLSDHPDLVEEDTVEALGELGGVEAVPHVARYLRSPRSQVRRAAAQARQRLKK